MKAVKRRYIDIDWEKLKILYPEMDDAQARCLKAKWSPFKDWQQGFDSDCFAHCIGYEICSKAFYDKGIRFKDHFKEILIPTEEKLFWGDKEVEFQDIVEDK